MSEKSRQKAEEPAPVGEVAEGSEDDVALVVEAVDVVEDSEPITVDWIKNEVSETANIIKTRLLKPIFKATRGVFADLKDEKK
jgi:hypothetical protein